VQIAARNLGVERRKVTIRDVGRAAGVSVATVSRALNGSNSVTRETRAHVQRVAKELDFVPHAGAQSLSLQRTDTIGVILPDLHGEYFSELIRGLDLGARNCRRNLLLSASHGDISEAIAALRTMRSRVDGLVVMSPFTDGELLVDAVNRAVPLVLLSMQAGSGADAAFGVDNRAGAAAVTRHLLDQGHRTVAFISGPADNLDAQERLRGFREAHAAAGAKPGPVLRGNFREESGFSAGLLLLQKKLPDAVFAANDAMALGCLQALRGGGVRIPEDVALAGFDDIPVARFLDPPLTTAGVPIADIGRQAIECCVRLGEGSAVATARTLFAPALVVRASSLNMRAAGPPHFPTGGTT
jgi:LacI family transcriptional regulator